MSTRYSPRRIRITAVFVSALFVMVTSTSDTVAQRRPHRPQRPTPAPRTAAGQHGDLVHISYPDSVDLAAFVDYVSQSLNLQIIYGDEIRNQSVVFRPGEVQVPKAQLLDLLRSMLRMRDLALVEGDMEGWLRIVDSMEMQRHVTEIRHQVADQESQKSNRIVTQVVHLASPDAQTVVKHARSFLSSPKASVIEIPDRRLLIITDYESAMARALEIIRLLDSAPDPARIVVAPLQHQDAKDVAERVLRVLGDKAKIEGSELKLTLQPSPHGGEILLVGPEESISEAQSLIEQFDVIPRVTRTTTAYSPTHVTASRLLRLVESVIAHESRQRDSMKFYLDEQTNRLYVTTTPDVHEAIKNLLDDEDVPTVESSKPLCIYRPKNRLARDLMGILSEVLPQVRTTSQPTNKVAADTGRGDAPATPGPNRPPRPPGPGQAPPVPPAQKPIDAPQIKSSQITRVEGEDFLLSYDDHTNSIIAVGPREFHTKLKALMTELDKRQPQVLIEMTLVAITLNDSFSLATELANEEKRHGYQSLFFSSFGLSDVDLATGARILNPGGGFNGVVLGPHETPIVLRAIAAHGDSRVITTPKVIVSDNTTASIGSVEEAPFTSINASDTVATTSFAGFESAGTVLTVTPHIAQGDHMTLDYSFNFSNFTGGGSVGVPPPRTTNTFSGTVEIPDAHTIIVGGLVTENEADSVTEVPLLGRIPVIGVLFQSSDRARTKSRIYAFIRATILRDDRFADLKMISRGEIERAALENRDYPGSEYVWMR